MKILNVVEYPHIKNLIGLTQKIIENDLGVCVEIDVRYDDEKLSKLMYVTDMRYRRAICAKFGVTWEEITGTLREAEIVAARHCYCYIAQIHMFYNLRKIGNILSRDHSTIIYSIRKMQAYIETKDIVGLTALEVINTISSYKP